MRGRQDPQVSMLAFIDIESRIPLDHPLRTIKYMADGTLAELSPLFDEMYALHRAKLPRLREKLRNVVDLDIGSTSASRHDARGQAGRCASTRFFPARLAR
jgi:hypothetical protein